MIVFHSLQAGYLSIAVLTLAHALIAGALGIAYSSSATAFLGHWWASIPLILAGILGICSALTGCLVECSGNIWVLTTAILSGIAMIIGLVALGLLGCLTSAIAQLLFLSLATALDIALFTYSVFLLGLGCQIPCNDCCEPVKCDPCGNNGNHMMMGNVGNMQQITMQF